ncbi:MAG: GntR family transcriptional regulator [Synergistaceae bacterium]|nr:GntR family transcriptional regulator [Synergistaceae bacterium]
MLSYFDMSELKDGVTRQVYLALRRDILNWRLLPGRRLSEKDIAGRMNISKTPVREAFIKLQAEGLLEIRPQRGTYISLMDMEQIEEVRFTRFCVESTVLSLFISSPPDEKTLSAMDSILDTQEQTIADRDVDGFVESDDFFHREFFLACGKARTWSFIDHFSAQYKRLRYLSLKNYLDFGKVLVEHRAILSACRHGDSHDALHWLSMHLNKILGESEHLREKFPEYIMKSGTPRDTDTAGTEATEATEATVQEA